MNRSHFQSMALFGGLLCVLVGLSGCYSFSATSLPEHIRTVRIDEVENRTLQATLGDRLRLGLVELFRKEASSVRVVNEDGDAEFRLVLRGYENGPFDYGRDATVQTYRTILVVDVEFRDIVKDRVLYEAKGLRAEGIYDVAKDESEELQGQQRALDKLKDLIVANALANW